MNEHEEYRHLWRCPRCTREQPPSEFYADRPGLAGALFWCRSCVTLYLQERRRRRKKRLTDTTDNIKEVEKVTKEAA